MTNVRRCQSDVRLRDSESSSGTGTPLAIGGLPRNTAAARNDSGEWHGCVRANLPRNPLDSKTPHQTERSERRARHAHRLCSPDDSRWWPCRHRPGHGQMAFPPAPPCRTAPDADVVGTGSLPECPGSTIPVHDSDPAGLHGNACTKPKMKPRSRPATSDPGEISMRKTGKAPDISPPRVTNHNYRILSASGQLHSPKKPGT